MASSLAFKVSGSKFKVFGLGWSFGQDLEHETLNIEPSFNFEVFDGTAALY
jgi:hypothetical protein